MASTLAWQSSKYKKLDELPTIFLAGNSTVTDQENEPWASWGQMFPNFLKPEVVVANYAESGETLLAFKRENRLQKILSQMKTGDYLLMGICGTTTRNPAETTSTR